AAPVVRAPATRDELAIKLALAATLPGVDVSGMIHAQRATTMQRLHDLRHNAESAGTETPEELARSLVLDSLLFAAEAELRLLDRAEQRLATQPGVSTGFGLATQRPRRGRPSTATAAQPEGAPA